MVVARHVHVAMEGGAAKGFPFLILRNQEVPMGQWGVAVLPPSQGGSSVSDDLPLVLVIC